jgi:hypothetical protein
MVERLQEVRGCFELSGSRRLVVSGFTLRRTQPGVAVLQGFVEIGRFALMGGGGITLRGTQPGVAVLHGFVEIGRFALLGGGGIALPGTQPGVAVLQKRFDKLLLRVYVTACGRKNWRNFS